MIIAQNYCRGGLQKFAQCVSNSWIWCQFQLLRGSRRTDLAQPVDWTAVQHQRRSNITIIIIIIIIIINNAEIIATLSRRTLQGQFTELMQVKQRNEVQHVTPSSVQKAMSSGGSGTKK